MKLVLTFEDVGDTGAVQQSLAIYNENEEIGKTPAIEFTGHVLCYMQEHLDSSLADQLASKIAQMKGEMN